MPKRVDHAERRQHIAAALLRVVARDGLDAVTLRHVASEAEVTTGTVQHYFSSKDDMVQFAMAVASERYERRITERVGALGADSDPSAVIRVLLGNLIPTTAAEADDARVALAFQAYAANNESGAVRLRAGDALLTEHIAGLLKAVDAGGKDPVLAATTLLATAEGLAMATLSAGLPQERASRALNAQIDALTRARVAERDHGPNRFGPPPDTTH